MWSYHLCLNRLTTPWCHLQGSPRSQRQKNTWNRCWRATGHFGIVGQDLIWIEKHQNGDQKLNTIERLHHELLIYVASPLKETHLRLGYCNFQQPLRKQMWEISKKKTGTMVSVGVFDEAELSTGSNLRRVTSLRSCRNPGPWSPADQKCLMEREPG